MRKFDIDRERNVSQLSNENGSCMVQKENQMDFTEDDEEDNLRSGKEFTFQLIRPTIKEQEQKDEDILMNDLSSRHNLTQPNPVSDFAETETECSFFQKKGDGLPKQRSANASNPSLKLLLIGDESSGKTYILRNYIFTHGFNLEVTQPTQSLEIHKMNYYTGRRTINLEFLDTNCFILNSSLIKSKINCLNVKLSAYLRICKAFILVCDMSNPNSIKFLELQLENIFNYSCNPKNIYLLINHSNPSLKLDDIWKCYFAGLIEKFHISKNRIQLVSGYSESKFHRFIGKCVSRTRKAQS